MPVAFVAAATNAAGGNDLTIASYTIAAGSDRLLLVGVVLEGDVSVSSVTYGGTGLTKHAEVEEGNTNGDPRVELWYLVAPAVGTADIVIDQTGGASSSIVGIASNWTGVSPSTPLGTAVTATGTDSPATLDVGSVGASDVVADIVGVFNPTSAPAVGGGQTLIGTDDPGGTAMGGAMSRESGSGTITMSWTLTPTSLDWAQSGVCIKGLVPQTVTPSPLAIPIALPTPTVVSLRTATPTPVALPIAFPVPVLALTAVTPAPVTVPIALPSVALVTVLLSPTPLVIPIAFPAPTIGGVRILTPSSVTVPIAFPSHGVGIDTPLKHRHRAVITTPAGTPVGQIIG